VSNIFPYPLNEHLTIQLFTNERVFEKQKQIFNKEIERLFNKKKRREQVILEKIKSIAFSVFVIIFRILVPLLIAFL